MSTEETPEATDTVDVTREEAPVDTSAKDEVDADVLDISIDHFTVDEIEVIEDIIDASIDSLSDPRSKKAKMLRAIAFVMKRREDENVTLESVGKLKIRFSEQPVPPTKSVTS